MEFRTERGWIKAGLAVLVSGVLGGGVMAATGIGPSRGPHKVRADGVAGKGLPAAADDKPLDLAAAPAASPEDDKPAPTVGDKITVGNDGGSVTVSAVEDNVSAGRLFGAGDGNKYIAVEVKGCSGPHEKNLTFEPAYFLLRLDDGTVHDPGPGAKKPSLEGGTVPAGKCLSGWVTYTVKDGGLPAAVIYDGSSRLTWTVPPPKGAKATTTTTTARSGAAAASSDDVNTTDSTKPKTTTTTSKSTTTTSKSTATTAKPTTTTATSKSTPTTAKATATPSTTRPSNSTTTTSSSGTRAGGSTTGTTGKPANPIPATPPTTSTGGAGE